MKSAKFMVEAQQNDIVFFMDGEALKMYCPIDVETNDELMQIIKSHKQGIMKHLVHGFECVRDGITVKEKRELVAASMRRHPET